MNNPQEMADVITYLAKQKGVSINKMLQECNQNKSLIDGLKKGQETSAFKLKPVADYFGVSVDYLLTEKINKIGALISVPSELENVLIASTGGEEDLTQEEVDEMANFWQYVKSKRKIRGG